MIKHRQLAGVLLQTMHVGMWVQGFQKVRFFDACLHANVVRVYKYCMFYVKMPVVLFPKFWFRPLV